MIMPETFVTIGRMESISWSAQEFLRVYDAALSLWEEQGWTPDRIGGIRPSHPGYFDAYTAAHRHPEPKDIQEEGIQVEKMQNGWRHDREWATMMCLSNYATDTGAHLLLGEAQLGITPDVSREIAREFLALQNGQYAYILRQQRRYGYCNFAPTESATTRLGQPRDHSMNTSWWGRRRPEVIDACLLRDIYPQSFLNEAYLDAPVGFSGLSLRKWIEAAPSERGELKPFTDTLTEWTPPVENIPKIREALFRGGRLFYWRFFVPTRRREGERAILPDGRKNPNLTEPEPFYRPDVLAPWESPEPIPEIYRAEYYKDKDPGLIY